MGGEGCQCRDVSHLDEHLLDNRSAGPGSLHVGVSPVPQGLMSLLDDLG